MQDEGCSNDTRAKMGYGKLSMIRLNTALPQPDPLRLASPPLAPPHTYHILSIRMPFLPMDPTRGPKDAPRTMPHPTRFPQGGAGRRALHKNHPRGLPQEPKKKQALNTTTCNELSKRQGMGTSLWWQMRASAVEYYRTYENCENR